MNRTPEAKNESYVQHGYGSAHQSGCVQEQWNQRLVSYSSNQPSSQMPFSTSRASGVRTIRSTGHQQNIEAAPIQGTCCNTPGSGVQESAVAYTPRFWMSNTKSSQEPEFSSPVARTQYHPNTYSSECKKDEKSNKGSKQLSNVGCHQQSGRKQIRQKTLLPNQPSAQECSSIVHLPSVMQESARSHATPSVGIDYSLHFITATIRGMKHWSKYAHKLQMLFEIFGILHSAVSTSNENGCVKFLVKDDIDSVPCIFYEIDRQLPRLIRAQWHRCVGTFNESKKTFHCVSVRAAEQAEIKLFKNQVNVCDRTLRTLVSKIAET